MKTLYPFLLAASFLMTNLVSARPVDKVIANGGNWSSLGTWSLGRIPHNGDSVEIPAFNSVVLDKSETLNNVAITIQGALILNNSSLTLDAASYVQLASGGWLFGDNFSSKETVSIGGALKFSGNTDFFISGPSTANKNTGTSPNGFSNNPIILPLTFTSFTVTSQNDNSVLVSWSTADEVNNSHFEIERSLDGGDWQVIASVLPGSNPQINNYDYTDKAVPNGTIYYRIKQVDLDGKFMYSATAVIEGKGAKATASIWSAGKNINIRLNTEISNRVTVRLVSINGQVLRQQTYEGLSPVISFNADGFNAGAYAVQVTDGNGLMVAKIVIL